MFWNYNSHKDTFFCSLFRCFPRATLIVELTHASNMRFMKFNADISLPPDMRSESMSSFKSRSLRESVKVKKMPQTKLPFLMFWTGSKIHTSVCRLCLFVNPVATCMILDAKTKRVLCILEEASPWCRCETRATKVEAKWSDQPFDPCKSHERLLLVSPQPYNCMTWKSFSRDDSSSNDDT